MSLFCVNCGKIIVLSDHPDHLAGCSSCKDLTEQQKNLILESSKEFAKLSQKRGQGI